MIGAYGHIWLQEKHATLRQLTKFDENLNRIFSRVISSDDVGNITAAVADGGNIFLACDGGQNATGAAKVFKYDQSLNGLARATYNAIGSVHHNAHSAVADGAGNIFVSISTGESGLDLARHVVKYDSSLVQLTSRSVSSLFLYNAPSLGYGDGTLYVAGESNPAQSQEVYLRRFDTSLGYSGFTATITVTGATPQFGLTTDPFGNAVLALTSSTADGGDFLVFKF